MLYSQPKHPEHLIYRQQGLSAEFRTFLHISAQLEDNEISEFSWECRVTQVHVIFKKWKHEIKYFCMDEKTHQMGTHKKNKRRMKSVQRYFKGI